MKSNPFSDAAFIISIIICMSRITHEVCIVGAGPVGLALANCLSRSPLISSIALIDRKLPQVMASSHALPNQRVFSINAPILQFLERIGALQRVRQMGRLQNIEVMSKESDAFIEWEEKSARIIENDELVSSLLQTLQQTSSKCKIDFIEDEIQTVSN
jgi:2-polyprenyl-6-methoxyphenol hydroxylase-like FAD-dependent oxidoreductase